MSRLLTEAKASLGDRPSSYLLWLAAVSAVVLAAASALRWANFKSPLLYAAIPLAPAALLGSLLLVVVLLTMRRAWRSTFLVATVGLGLALWMLPGSLPPRLICAEGRSESAVLIYSHNVSYEAGDPTAVAKEIAALQPDVVLLQEADRHFVASIQRDLVEPYPHSAQASSQQTLSLAILSRTALDDVVDTTDQSSERNPFLMASVELPAGALRVANVHMSAPRSTELLARRNAELGYLADSDFLDLEVDLLMGDFNSSEAHRDFRSTINSIDGTILKRCGMGGTWSPLGTGPGLLALDHAIVVNGEAGNSTLRPVGYAGSDHRGLALLLDG